MIKYSSHSNNSLIPFLTISLSIFLFSAFACEKPESASAEQPKTTNTDKNSRENTKSTNPPSQKPPKPTKIPTSQETDRADEIASKLCSGDMISVDKPDTFKCSKCPSWTSQTSSTTVGMKMSIYVTVSTTSDGIFAAANLQGCEPPDGPTAGNGTVLLEKDSNDWALRGYTDNLDLKSCERVHVGPSSDRHTVLMCNSGNLAQGIQTNRVFATIFTPDGWITQTLAAGYNNYGAGSRTDKCTKVEVERTNADAVPGPGDQPVKLKVRRTTGPRKSEEGCSMVRSSPWNDILELEYRWMGSSFSLVESEEHDPLEKIESWTRRGMIGVPIISKEGWTEISDN